MSFFKAYDFPVIFTRAANVYGPGQQLYRIIPRTILSALTGKNMELHGGGKSIRSFIHINDVVKATMKIALKAEPGTSWHISSNTSISIYNLVQKIFDLTNAKFGELVIENNLVKSFVVNPKLSKGFINGGFMVSDKRLLDEIKPNFVNVMSDGQIIKTGESDLALELEEKGYEWTDNFIKET